MRTFALSTVAVVSALVLAATNAVAHAAPETDTTKPAPSIKMVAIKPGDYLSKIATENSTTAQRLFDANPKVENPDLIYPGDQLRVPSSDEELATRAMPVEPVATEVAAVAAAPVPTQRSSTAPTVASGSVWDQLAACEAGGNWAANTGNGFYGGLQFTISSWQAVGGSGLPSDASREEQIMRAESLLARQGWGAWPACTSKLGLR